MMLTIYTLFNDPNIVNAVIQRVLQTRKDTIYWQQYLDFRRTTTRVFKDYIGQVPSTHDTERSLSVNAGILSQDMVKSLILVMLTKFLLTACQNFRT